DQLAVLDDDLVRDGVDDALAADAAGDGGGEPDLHLFTAANNPLGNALRRSAVVQRDDYVLGHVGQLAGEIAGVRRFEGGVGQTLASAVGGAEIFQHRESFAEV